MTIPFPAVARRACGSIESVTGQSTATSTSRFTLSFLSIAGKSLVDGKCRGSIAAHVSSRCVTITLALQFDHECNCGIYRSEAGSYIWDTPCSFRAGIGFFGKYPQYLPLTEEQIAKIGGPVDIDGVRNVKGIIDSEKETFFEDPAVQDRLKELGFTVSVTTTGSREMVDRNDLTRVHLVFPLSGPAADHTSAKLKDSGKIDPFFSPMTIAIFAPVVTVLERAGVVHQAGGQTVLDVQGYIYLTKEGKRWNDLVLEVCLVCFGFHVHRFTSVITPGPGWKTRRRIKIAPRLPR